MPFVALALDKEEQKEVEKVHKYFGHKSGRKVWKLFATAGKLNGKKKAVLELLDKCKICCELKKTPPRQKIGMPVENNFNEVVGMDLKVLKNGIVERNHATADIIYEKLIMDNPNLDPQEAE